MKRGKERKRRIPKFLVFTGIAIIIFLVAITYSGKDVMLSPSPDGIVETVSIFSSFLVISFVSLIAVIFLIYYFIFIR